jgi:hypothetical protein
MFDTPDAGPAGPTGPTAPAGPKQQRTVSPLDEQRDRGAAEEAEEHLLQLRDIGFFLP